MDFDDLLVRTVRLFREHPEVLERYQERFVHVLVDEYQDTNRAQNELVIDDRREARATSVSSGDSDQSIYRFRGAEMRNLLDFERAFPEARMIVLDQNYRSTQTILDAANAVIGNNLLRQEKELWSALGKGEPIRRYRAGDERDEATFVAERDRHAAAGTRASATATSRSSTGRTPRAARSSRRSPTGASPTRVIGGTRFYDRREIRDVLAYLRPSPTPATRCRCAASSTCRDAASATRPSGAARRVRPRRAGRLRRGARARRGSRRVGQGPGR